MLKWRDLSNEQKKEYTKTQTDEARFWTGSTGPHSGPQNAENLAKQDGGKALEMILRDNEIEMPDYFNVDGSINEEAKAAWSSASEYFAQNASGDVICYKGDIVNFEGTYTAIEKQFIEGNTGISSIKEVDCVTGQQTETTYSRDSKADDLEDANGNNYSFYIDEQNQDMLSQPEANDEKFSYEALGANDSQPSNDNGISSESEQAEEREEGYSL